jgi:hypothetical protein
MSGVSTAPDGRRYVAAPLAIPEGLNCLGCAFARRGLCLRPIHALDGSYWPNCVKPNGLYIVWTEVTSPATDELED